MSAQRRPSLSLSLARPRSCASRLTKHPRVLTSSGHWWSADNSIPPKARVQFASASTPFREIVYSSPTIGWPPPSPPLIAAAVGGFSRVPGCLRLQPPLPSPRSAAATPAPASKRSHPSPPLFLFQYPLFLPVYFFAFASSCESFTSCCTHFWKKGWPSPRAAVAQDAARADDNDSQQLGQDHQHGKRSLHTKRLPVFHETPRKCGATGSTLAYDCRRTPLCQMHKQSR